jgi:DNA-binding MarR family transcriptional regulator
MEKELVLVIKGNIRKQIILNLTIPNTPTNLAKKLNAHRSSVSRTLLFLEKSNLVKCINKNDSFGRVYKLTEKGKKVYDIVRKM